MFDDVRRPRCAWRWTVWPCASEPSPTNIANIETPGYQARKVKFEEALAKPSPTDARPTGAPRRSAARWSRPAQNGNNVNLDQETLSNIDTGLRYQLALRAMDGKFGLLRDAIKGAD